MKVLYLTHRVPYAPNRGDRIRAYHTLETLRRSGAAVHLVALAHGREEARNASRLAALADSVDVVRISRVRQVARGAVAFGRNTTLTHALLDAPKLRATLARSLERFGPDVVLSFCTGMARAAMEWPLAGLPFVLDMVDVDSEKWSDFARRSAVLSKWVYQRESGCLAAFERTAALAAAATIVINEREAALVARLAPAANIVIAGNGVDAAYFRPPADAGRRKDIVFTAVFDYEPNVSGALWFVREVWPAVRSAHPDTRLLLVGARPSRRLRALRSLDDRIVVTGAVDDVRPYLWASSVSVAPLQMSRGTQNKVLEALAAGLPSIVTRPVWEGLPAGPRDVCGVADEPAEFAGLVIDALRSAALPYEPGLRAAQALTWGERLKPMIAAVEAAAAARSSVRPPRTADAAGVR